MCILSAYTLLKVVGKNDAEDGVARKEEMGRPKRGLWVWSKSTWLGLK